MAACIRGRAPSSSLSYHESGSHLFVASEDDCVLRVVDCLNGGAPHMIKLQREGIRTVKATHHSRCVLFSPGSNSGPKKNNVYYLSVHDNKILREFEGHQGVITSMSISPVDDTFLSSSADGTVRYVDLITDQDDDVSKQSLILVRSLHNSMLQAMGCRKVR